MAEPKSMDVAKSGKAAPDTTGRPVIVGHKPLLKQDPMVNDTKGQTEIEEKTADAPLTPHTEKVIEPPSTEVPNAEEKKADTKSSKTENEADSPATDAVDKSVEDETQQPVSDDAAVVDAIAEQAGANKKKPGELTPEEKKRQEAIDKLIEEKKYFIPIKVASRKRQARWNTVILFCLLLGVGGYLLVDAGIVGTNIKVPFDIIPNAVAPVESGQQVVPPAQPPVAQPTNNTYTSNIDGFKLTYPLTWQKTDRTVTGSPEYLELKPKTLSESDKLVSVELSRGDDPSRTTTPNTTLRQVTYTDVNSVDGKKLYLREIITSSTQDGILVWTGLTDYKGMEKTTQIFGILDTAFTAADGKTKVKFNTHTATSSNGKAGFASIEAAQAYITTNKDYLDAKSILMSLKFK